MNEEKKQKQQEQMRQQERIIQRRKEICAEYPEIGKFIYARDKWVNMLLLSGFILHIVQAVWMKTAMNLSTFGAVAIILGYWKFLLILLMCRGTELRFLYAAGALCAGVFGLTIMKIMGTVGYSLENLIYLYQEAFRISPGSAVLDLLMWIFMIAVLITVFYLALAPKSKNFIEQFDRLIKNG